MDEVWYRAPDWATTNPLALVFYGIVGGAFVAVVLMWLHRKSQLDLTSKLDHIEQISLDVINFSHLQVVGFGGFALVVMCAMVAIVIPPVGVSLLIGCVAGTTVAIVLVIRRGKAGPISSSTESPGANTTFHLADEQPSAQSDSLRNR